MDKNSMKEVLRSLPVHGISQKYIEKHYPEINSILMGIGDSDDMQYTERIYWFLNDIEERPRCICGNPLTFRGVVKGYSAHCCTRCASNDITVKQKTEQTLKEKYGGDYGKELSRRIREAVREKYGVDNPFQSEEVKAKIKSIINQKYGVDYPSQSERIQETRRINTMAKYGVDHHSKIPEVRAKIVKSNQNTAILGDDMLIGYDNDGNRIMKCPHLECNKCKEKTYIISPKIYFGRKQWNIEPCTRLLPIEHSRSKGSEIEKFVTGILDEHHIKYETNVRSIIPPNELDVWIPSMRIAIECNGVYWHSEANGKDRKYHINKYINCKSHNIRLITIWEDWIKTEPEIVRSVILSKLGIYNEKIGARECEITTPAPGYIKFLDENHIQGHTNASATYALMYNGEMVGVMTFSHKTAKDDDTWLLTRFCTRRGLQIIGGAGKLLKRFIQDHNPKEIISFASNDISDGKLYESLGFERDDSISSSYWYVSKKTYKRYHRTTFNKIRLKKLGFDTENKTEIEITKDLPLWRIYDSGHTKFTLKIKDI